MNQWIVENKNAFSNAYFSLSKTYNGQTYCAMPSLDASGKISLVLKKKSDTIEQHVFSSPRRTPLAITNFISLPGCTKHTHQVFCTDNVYYTNIVSHLDTNHDPKNKWSPVSTC